MYDGTSCRALCGKYMKMSHYIMFDFSLLFICRFDIHIIYMRFHLSNLNVSDVKT